MKTPETEKETSKALAYLGLLLFSIPLTVFQVFVLIKLWQWFLVYGFGLQPLTWPLSFGLCILGGHVRTRRQIYKRELPENFAFLLCTGLFDPAVALFFGWVAHNFL